MRERLKSNLSEKVIQYLFAPSIKGECNRSFENMMEVNKAHLMMLVSEDIIAEDVGCKIMKALTEISESGSRDLEIDPGLEDLYFNIEAKLIEKVGVEIGGQLHTGRSRNDLYATVTRLNSRKSVLKLCHLVLELRETLLKLAKDNKKVTMSGYTHMQPAEPITLGHYFSAILYALERDFCRFMRAFQNTNLSPLGSGAMASTTFQIDRKRTAQLLGFTGALGNSLDGIASRDYMLEIVSAMNIFMNTLSRLSYDLYIWSTDEYSLVEVDDSVAASSSIMPQKKNPITLEHIKGKSAHVLGALVSITSSIKNTPYGHSRDLAGESQKCFWDAMNETEASLEILIETIKTMKFNEERMLSQATRNFSTVTELANILVREAQVSFRQAHQIVGQLVNYLLESKLTVTDITPELIKDVAFQVLNSEISVQEEAIQKALDPVLNVNSKNASGGPAPLEVENQLKALKNRLERDTEWFEEQKNAIHNRKESLLQAQI
ncbi:argininosuccinate lyase [Lentibacillus sp. N15]|uniref:argininosuccinate lyase n=1 Tax=Lentibacillus songyuanensis TaxID=3136161 RepID=UPI0031BB3819